MTDKNRSCQVTWTSDSVEPPKFCRENCHEILNISMNRCSIKVHLKLHMYTYRVARRCNNNNIHYSI